jgi:eukaryotic-like serine/threonine-protein kinase
MSSTGPAASSSTLGPGVRLAERYVIVSVLGAGGMGVVFRARDEKLGRHVALKTLAPDKVGDARARSRLLREARAAAALEHPAIAQVYDVGEIDDGGAYFVMELVRGKSVRQLILEKLLDRDAILRMLGEVATDLF